MIIHIIFGRADDDKSYGHNTLTRGRLLRVSPADDDELFKRVSPPPKRESGPKRLIIIHTYYTQDYTIRKYIYI